MPLRRRNYAAKSLPDERPTQPFDEKTVRLIKSADSDAESFDGEMMNASDIKRQMEDDYWEDWEETEPKPTTSNKHRRKSAATYKELQKLNFGKPGSATANFVAADYVNNSTTVRRSQRRMELDKQRRSKAKAAGDLQTASAPEPSSSTGHDRSGQIITPDGRRVHLCDCLDKECVGCHMPCPKCRSALCGSDCQRGRRYFYSEIQINGQPRHTVTHPYYKD